MSVETFEKWKSNPSQEGNLEKVELLSALAYGKVRIESEEGSSIVLGAAFDVDSSGVVQANAEVNIVERRVLTDGTEYPAGLVLASFFQTDNVAVGEPFRIITRKPGTASGVVAVLQRVAKVTIDRESSVDDVLGGAELAW